ncbi:cell division protein [Romboutsia lituseburensis]|uniref:cell division protein n=1 Tax=Romboutsia lituseburensis TaxID=1537 RepID=UPI00215B6D78|nr:cell division protein [Romboutsia lituseburensis]MCR8744508.1 cell division protein [Romboutsia lituseburensis]
MNEIEKIESAKMIGIGEDGIKTLDSISDKIVHNMDLEKITVNQDVDKDYVRELLDGVDVLFLTHNSEDKKSLQIVNAIGYMADERRVLSVGLDSAKKENKDDVNLNREFKINDENTDTLLNVMNMLLDSISDSCMINIDLSDLKETLCSEKGIKYSCGEFDKSVNNDGIVNVLLENTIESGEEFVGKKQVILVEMDSNYCEEEKMLIILNDLLMKIQDSNKESYETIFSLYIREKSQEKIKIGLVCN